MWKKKGGRTAVHFLRPLRYLVECEVFECEDGLDPLWKVRFESRLLPSACWHGFSLLPSCENFRFASILARPCNARKSRRLVLDLSPRRLLANLLAEIQSL